LIKKESGEVEELYHNVSANNAAQVKNLRDRIGKTIAEIQKQ
jgi:hypothetical protein